MLTIAPKAKALNAKAQQNGLAFVCFERHPDLVFTAEKTPRNRHGKTLSII